MQFSHIREFIIIALIGGIFSRINYENIFSWKYIYFTFSEELTPLIDTILLDKNYGLIGKIRIEEGGFNKPDLGTHYYYEYQIYEYHPLTLKYVVLNKKEKDGFYYYEGYTTKIWGKNVLEDLQNKLTETTNDEVNVVSIVATGQKPYTTMLKMAFKKPHYGQISGIKHILSAWENNHNVKCIITGESGIGKSALALQVKKYFDKKYSTKLSKLFINFNPSIPGMDIAGIILNKATEQTPVIIMLDEIDVYLNLTQISKVDYYDNRVMYTKDKSTWNTMMDLIASHKNIFLIGTTQKTQEELFNNLKDENKSMIRFGRIDFFLQLTKNNCVKIKNNYGENH